MSDESNRREFTRVPVNVKATVTSDKTTLVSQRTRDISMNGFYIECETDLVVGDPCDVQLELDGLGTGVIIRARGKVARRDDGGFGVNFETIRGLESYDHLRNLVLYNSNSALDQVEKEIREHSGLRRRDV